MPRETVPPEVVEDLLSKTTEQLEVIQCAINID